MGLRVILTIHGARVGAPKPVLEVPDIIALAAEAAT